MQKPWKFSYETVDRATNGFNNSNVLGRGLTGVVYRRVMPCTHKQVAAKVILHNNDFGEDQYRTEITTLGRISHQNAVPLRGYSKSKNRYLFMILCPREAWTSTYMAMHNLLWIGVRGS